MAQLDQTDRPKPAAVQGFFGSRRERATFAKSSGCSKMKGSTLKLEEKTLAGAHSPPPPPPTQQSIDGERWWAALKPEACVEADCERDSGCGCDSNVQTCRQGERTRTQVCQAHAEQQQPTVERRRETCVAMSSRRCCCDRGLAVVSRQDLPFLPQPTTSGPSASHTTEKAWESGGEEMMPCVRGDRPHGVTEQRLTGTP